MYTTILQYCWGLFWLRRIEWELFLIEINPGSVCLGIQKHKNHSLKNGGFVVDRQFFWMYAVCRNTLLLSLGDIHFFEKCLGSHVLLNHVPILGSSGRCFSEARWFPPARTATSNLNHHELRVNWETPDFWNCSPPIPTIKNSQSRPTIACYQMVNWSNLGSRKKPNLRIHGTWQRDFVLGIRSFSNFFCCLGSGGKFLGGVFLSLGYLGSSNLFESDDTVSTWNFTCRQVSPAKACVFLSWACVTWGTIHLEVYPCPKDPCMVYSSTSTL